MSEMLANQYFMVRRFADAEAAFENVLKTDVKNKASRKKIIICYLYNGKIDQAMDLFYDLIQEDIEFIINTDIIADDCPCPELIERFETALEPEYNSVIKLEMLGILWLYCSIEKSEEYFIKLKQENPSKRKYRDILDLYDQYSAHKQSLS